jgi:ATP-dependent helicase/nuclease subunit B
VTLDVVPGQTASSCIVTETPTFLTPDPAAPHPAAPHPAAAHWSALLAQMDEFVARQGLSPSRLLVLVPYAQLMEGARSAWARAHPTGLVPRFESSRNWAASLMPFSPGPSDCSGDVARDSLVAAALIDRVAQDRPDPALRAVLVSRLIDAAHQIAPLAAAQPPERRTAWGQAMTLGLQAAPAVPHWEGIAAALAVAWVSSSSFATDVLWGPLAAPGVAADGLVLLEGFQQDPLGAALLARWGDRALCLSLHRSDQPRTDKPYLYPCGDAEDEAQTAAACVIRRLNATLVPVALVATDRQLIRRISAMLVSAGVVLRDETGWKLSTSHAAARLMALLRAAEPRAPLDDVLDLLKLSSAWPSDAVQALEQWTRERRLALWRSAMTHPDLQPLLPAGLPELLSGLQGPRSLAQWVTDLTAALQQTGQWDALQRDAAGQRAIDALRLGQGAALELQGVSQSLAELHNHPRGAPRLTLAAFTSWVREVLEAASFTPPSPGPADVVILPLAQLLGRPFAAVVMPGCDEQTLSPSPEPPGHWTAAQREALGLPGREDLARATRAAWVSALEQPCLDILWRTSERGQRVPPSPWLDPWLVAAPVTSTPDPREMQALERQEACRPLPTAAELLPERLSASAYQDLRDCPYRFFALRQMRLKEAEELDAEPDQRDVGNWLHAVLRAFHEQRRDQRPGRDTDAAQLNALARSVATEMGLDGAEGGAGFLPFRAVWPGLREGYLDWLQGFEASDRNNGPTFECAEAERMAQAGLWRLFGKLDRIDTQPSPEGPIAVVIDYKTERREKTRSRVKQPLEDTQLAFYAALLPQDNLRAGYLSVTDRGRGSEPATVLVEQQHVLMAREHLLRELPREMAAIQAGHPLPALGEGGVCEHCAARGLCRRDFWSEA